jgi:hypothetical protein
MKRFSFWYSALWYFCCLMFGGLLWAFVQCDDSSPNAKSAADISALELACVEVSATREASRDCRNAVRHAWAKTYGLTISDLDGGTINYVDTGAPDARKD